MYQCIHKDAPELFSNFFSTNSDYSDYLDHDTRLSEDLHVPYGRLDVKIFSIIIHGANMWNSLPNQIKNAQSVHVFKQQFRNYWIQSVLVSTGIADVDQFHFEFKRCPQNAYISDADPLHNVIQYAVYIAKRV